MDIKEVGTLEVVGRELWQLLAFIGFDEPSKIVLYLSKMNLIEHDLVWVSYAIKSRYERQQGHYQQGEFEVPARLFPLRDLYSERVYDGVSFAVAGFVDIGVRGSKSGLLLASRPHCSLRR